MADDSKTSKKDPALLKVYGKTEAGRVRYFKRSSKYNTKYTRLLFVNGTASCLTRFNLRELEKDTVRKGD